MNKGYWMGKIKYPLTLQKTSNGVDICVLTIVVPRKTRSEMFDELTCVAKKYHAVYICKYFKQGDLIQIDGTVQVRKDKDNNAIYEIFVINAKKVEQIAEDGDKL